MDIRTKINQLLNVPSTDPGDARRRKLLNIFLLGVMVLTLLGLLATLTVSIASAGVSQGEAAWLYASFLAMLLGVGVTFAINRYWSGWIASSIFLVLLAFIFAFADEPQEVVSGRTLFTFAIPILTASVLLRPYASFVFAILVSLLLAGVALSAGIVPNFIATLGFFTLALISWLAARSLEQALADLRAINRELDQRVDERTRDLSAALSREMAEAGKNQAILEGIADGVIVFDSQGRAIVANPAITRLIGRPMEEIIDRDIKTLVGKDVSAEDREMIGNLLGDKYLHVPSFRFNWGSKTLSVSVASVRTALRETIGTVAVFRDFTREAEVERMKNAFVSMVSHDLRTPLSAIIGYADMLREAVYGPLSTEQLNVLQRINANAGRQLNMINNILDQTQIEAGILSIRVRPFDPHKLLADMESVMGVLAQSKELELIYSIADDVPSALPGDRRRLHQVLVNLVNNAVKFTEQGQVSVRVYCPDADHWAVDVSDTGPGIPPEAQSHIFDAFWQAADPVTRKHSGFGLGLSIVKQLITLMNGEIKLSSEVGRGSTFTFVLPLAPM